MGEKILIVPYEVLCISGLASSKKKVLLGSLFAPSVDEKFKAIPVQMRRSTAG